MAKKNNNIIEDTQTDIWGIKQAEEYNSFTEEEKEAIELFVPKESYFVQSTYNYDMFKIMEGNREIEHDRPIRESIINVGLLPIPVIVNEFMEIADGQGRLTACKDLHLPIYYMVVEGLKLEHVRIINSIFKRWSTRNYIQSYCTGEDKRNDYIYLERLLKNYGSYFTNAVIYSACGMNDGTTSRIIRDGNLTLNNNTYNIAINKLEYLLNFREYVNKISGTVERLYKGIMFCYSSNEVDNLKLLEQFKKHYAIIEPIVSVDQAMMQLEKVYNRKRPLDTHLDIHGLYKEHLKAIARQNRNKKV